MIRAYHAIFTAYGFWLPNDPRGSWSDFVGAWELRRFGPATKTTTRRSVAHADHDRRQRSAAKAALRFPPVQFNGIQARAVARGFATAVERSAYRIHACAILPDHVHLVVARDRCRIEQIVRRLKQAATTALAGEGLLPRCDSPWARGGWHVFLNTPDDVRRAIAYVRQNPIKEGLRPQRWWFETPHV